VLSNAGSSVGGSVLNGMNWAIANRCQVISMSLGSQSGVQPAYTAAGQAALNNGLLMIAAAGNAGLFTGAPANSPTIMSVASLGSLRCQERHQHGHSACRRMRGLVGGDLHCSARAEPAEQTHGDRQATAVRGIQGRRGPCPSTLEFESEKRVPVGRSLPTGALS
jgi:hypothetical protein